MPSLAAGGKGGVISNLLALAFVAGLLPYYMGKTFLEPFSLVARDICLSLYGLVTVVVGLVGARLVNTYVTRLRIGELGELRIQLLQL